MSKVGDFIRERRLAKGLSKRQLAEKAGISHSEVHRIENGERQNPSVPMLIALANALGIPQDDILVLSGYKTDDDNIPMIERVFPDLKTPKQQETAQKIVDGLSRNSQLKDAQYDELVRQVEMYLDYAKKNSDS
jgi:transcriptional regulator with XRE-family HTH domain